MPPRTEQQLKKGVLDLLVLSLLAEAPSHGYGLIQQLRARGGALFEVKEGTLYPVLYRLEDAGFLTAAWQSPDGQPHLEKMPRKQYTLTDAGRAELARQTALWREFTTTVNTILEGEHHES